MQTYDSFREKSDRFHIHGLQKRYDSHGGDPMKKILTVLLCAVLLIFSGCAVNPENKTMTITVFAAGKADAILIETEDGNVLIDTGLDENKETLLSELRQRNIEELDALIITHFDKDHTGGADAVIEELSVTHVYTTYQTKSSDDISEFEEALRAGGLAASVIQGKQTFTLGTAVFEIYGASDSYEKDASNNSSLIVRLTFGEKTYLFMGDAQDERIEEFLTYGIENADFLKVPYHGHAQDTLSELIAALRPQVSVITDSEEEPSEKEISQTVRLLEESGSTVYQTKDGAVTVNCTAESFTVSQ